MRTFLSHWFCRIFQFCLVFAFLRVGEARNPGPPFVLGTFNACGLLNKGEFLSELPRGCYGVTETHLTKEGQRRFQQELHHNVPGARIVHGYPSESLSSQKGSIGGKATGVAILAHFPVRPLTSQWEDQSWESARIQTAGVFIDPVWIKVGVCYGYAKAPHTTETVKNTDWLLQQLTQRIVFDAKGPRAIIGDFNNSKQNLPQLQIWRQEGFVEVQVLAWQKWQREITATFRGKSVVDFVWVSRELAEMMEGVITDETTFPDHAVVGGIFRQFSVPPPVRIWPKPLPLPWKDVDKTAEVGIGNFVENVSCSQANYQSICQSMEEGLHAHLLSHGKAGLLPQQKGRAMTLQAVTKRHQITPLKRSRKNEVPVTFMGESFQHVKWCKQVRRLQALHQSFRSEAPIEKLKVHQQGLWQDRKSVV